MGRTFRWGISALGLAKAPTPHPGIGAPDVTDSTSTMAPYAPLENFPENTASASPMWTGFWYKDFSPPAGISVAIIS